MIKAVGRRTRLTGVGWQDRLGVMPTSIHLMISANGVSIEGDADPGGASGFIGCLSFSDGVATDQAPTGRSLGRRHYHPVVVTKVADSTSPQLLRVLSENEPLSAVVHFVRADEAGTDEHYFTVDIPVGRLVTIERSWSTELNALVEELTIVPDGVVWTYAPDGSSYESKPRRNT